VNRHLAGLPRNWVYVFAETDGEPPWDFTHSFATAAKKAGIPDLHLHDLRHTFASWRAMVGVDLLTIKELGGWKNPGDGRAVRALEPRSYTAGARAFDFGMN